MHFESETDFKASYQSLLINVIVNHVTEGDGSLQEADRML